MAYGGLQHHSLAAELKVRSGGKGWRGHTGTHRKHSQDPPSHSHGAQRGPCCHHSTGTEQGLPAQYHIQPQSRDWDGLCRRGLGQAVGLSPLPGGG